MMISCTRCGGSGNKPEEEQQSSLSFEKYEDWLNHLITSRHRVAVEGTLTQWEGWEDERSLVVEHTESLRPRQVVEFFSKMGIIWEFYYSKNMSFCVLRLEAFEGKKVQLNGKKDLKIRDVKVKVTEKNAITPTYWTFLLNPATPPQSSAVAANLRIEATSDSRRVTVLPGKKDVKKGKDKLKGIFSEETAVPGPISAPIVVISNTNIDKQSIPSPSSSEIHQSIVNPSQVQSSSSKPKKTRSKRKKDKSGGGISEDSNAPKPLQVQSSRIEVQDGGAVSDSGSSSKCSSELPLQSSRKPELDFRGGFQVGSSQRTSLSSNQVPPSQPSPSPVIRPTNNNNVQRNPPLVQAQPLLQSFTGANTAVHIHPRFNRFQEVSQPQIPHPVIVPVTVAHVQAMQGSSQRQRYPGVGPSVINNIRNIGPIHISDPYAQQRYNQRFPPNVVVVSAYNNNAYQQRQTQPAKSQVPIVKPETPKYQKLFFDLIEKDNHSKIKEDFTSLSLQEQLNEFMRAMTLDERGVLNRKRLVEDIQFVLRQENELRHCKLYPFGSFITGLGDVQSDVDLYVDAYGTTEGFNLPSKPLSNVDLLNFCRRVLKKARCPRTNQYFCNQLIPIREARVPILKLRHVPTQIHCDLSFENLISVRNSEMITLFTALHPVVKPLMTLLRYWGKFHSLTGSNSIKNYALNLLVLVYLANQRFIPSIYDIQCMYWKTCKKSNYVIDGWDTSFCADVSKICKEFKPTISAEKAASNLPKLIITLAMGFFEMFGNADFSINMVCTLTGEFLPKTLFNAGYETDLPDFLERYKDWSAKQTSDRRLNVKNPLCIQDPFVLSFNVGSVCPPATLLKFQVACVQTMNILKNKENYSSLLDAFCRLPPEVGDKKFISLQERQKQTKKLITEVKEQFEGKSNTPEQKETVAAHLRPIQEIVDKKTIELGKGWQSYQTFQPDSSFQEKFSRWMRMCQLYKKQPPENLFQSMKKLWGVFVDEFFDVVWNKCFNLIQNKEHISFKKRIYSGSTLSPKFRQTWDNLFCDNKKDKKGRDIKNIPIIISPESSAPLVAQLSSLESIEERLAYMRYKCSTTVATWEKRERLFKQICEGLNDSETSAKDSPSTENEKPKKKKKEIRESKKKNRSARLKLNKSPLEIEEEITKLILESSKPSATPILVFYCLVKMDFSSVDELPTVYVVYEKDESTDYHLYCVGVSTLSAVIEDLLPEYVRYRLQQWFEEAGLYESILQANSDTELKVSRSKNQNSKSKSESEKSVDVEESAQAGAADNDPDLLIPPSSDEESDDNDDLNNND